MKKQLILSLLFFLSIAVYSQEHSPPHIDVTGTAEMEVVPDEIYIAISIHERTEGREVLTVEQQESNLGSEKNIINGFRNTSSHS